MEVGLILKKKGRGVVSKNRFWRVVRSISKRELKIRLEQYLSDSFINS